MTGSIRLYVDRAPARRREPSPLRPRRPIISAPSCAAAQATPCGLFNGRDGEFVARIEAVRRDRATLRVERQLRAQAPEPDLWLVFALLKRDATDLVVQKATELGVARLLPVTTERSNTHRVNAGTAGQRSPSRPPNSANA